MTLSPILIGLIVAVAPSIPPVFIIIVPLMMLAHHVTLSPILVILISHMPPRHRMSVFP
jgi:hypothetical protein